MMNEIEQKLHRTWVQLLVENGFREIAAIAIETEISIRYDGYDPSAISFDVATNAYSYVKNNERIRNIMERAMVSVSSGHIYGNNYEVLDNLPFTYRTKLIEVEEGWQNVIRNLVANAQDPNQGTITEKAFSKSNKQPYLYNEMKFASQSEIRIAQELEGRKVLFFPLPLAVRADTGNFYNDHREVDFLICQDGAWGILEVSYHPDRFEKDSEKDIWFKKSGILCIQHYTAERCFNSPANVVEEFLGILAKYKK